MEDKFEESGTEAGNAEETIAESPEELENQQISLEKAWQKEHKKEIKRILLGNLIPYEDGTYGAGNGILLTSNGVADGAQAAMLWGITEQCFLYDVPPENHIKAVYHVSKIMKKLGKPLTIRTIPDSSACYVRNLPLEPVVLLFEDREMPDGQKLLILHAYCGRGLFSWLAIKRAVKVFEEKLPKHIFTK